VQKITERMIINKQAKSVEVGTFFYNSRGRSGMVVGGMKWAGATKRGL